MIILEGADNSGKSTLADKFSKMGLRVHPAGPAPKGKQEELDCLRTQYHLASQDGCVLDRVTCISQQIYADRMFDKVLSTALMQIMELPSTVLVYCRPPNRVLMDMSTHKVKTYDTEEHLQKIIENQHKYIERYDSLMSTLPAIVYDWTDQSLDVNGFLKTIIDAQLDKQLWTRLCQPSNHF